MTQEEFVDMLVAKSEEATPAPGKRAKINMDLVDIILLHDEPEEAKTLKRAKGRCSTGFIKADQVQAAISDHEDDKSVSFQKQPSLKGMGMKASNSQRKSTGAITKEDLLKILAEVDEEEDEDEEEEASREGSNMKVSFAAKEMEKGAERKSVRKGTGFVTKAMLQKVQKVYSGDSVP